MPRNLSKCAMSLIIFFYQHKLNFICTYLILLLYDLDMAHKGCGAKIFLPFSPPRGCNEHLPVGCGVGSLPLTSYCTLMFLTNI